jgi:hypothetical protein
MNALGRSLSEPKCPLLYGIPYLGGNGGVCLSAQPGLQSEFQESQGYTEKPCFEKSKKKKKSQMNHQDEIDNSGMSQALKMDLNDIHGEF